MTVYRLLLSYPEKPSEKQLAKPANVLKHGDILLCWFTRYESGIPVIRGTETRNSKYVCLIILSCDIRKTQVFQELANYKIVTLEEGICDIGFQSYVEEVQ